MISKDIRKLLETLNESLTRGLENAVLFCDAQKHYEVAPEHLLVQLIDQADGDFEAIFSHFSIDGTLFRKGLHESLSDFEQGNSGRPSFSPLLLDLVEAAWVFASIERGQRYLRSADILQAMLEVPFLKDRPYMGALEGINRETLHKQLGLITASSNETEHALGKDNPDTFMTAGSALGQFTTDLTEKARSGNMDPILGRDKEVRMMIDILIRRRKNNPILVGEAGVGKTAVVEGLALRVGEGDVPDALKGVSILTLDLGALQAGASVKGEFERRLKTVIEEVKSAPVPIILFIDEAHTLIGAGGSAGTGDAANLLKPALARGELRTVAATTWAEYKKYIEKDPALERRFQPVVVEEPSVDLAATMLRGIKGKLEIHHKVRITDEAVQAAAEWSHRYISGRQLPDKAVDVLDTACARVKLTQSATPPSIDDMDRALQHIELELKSLEQDNIAGIDADLERVASLRESAGSLQKEREDAAVVWGKAKELAGQILSLRDELQEAEEARKNAHVKVLRELASELENLQGEDPLVFPEVSAAVIGQVVSDWTGIPLGNMIRDEAQTLVALEDLLGERILGQSEVVSELAESIRVAKAGIANPDAPLGVFLFVGPSGVGKTETALALADMLFGGDKFLTTINMSEYQESHTVSQLKGAPHGYVGFGEGGVLTEAVRRQPYSVVLLDEVEKAHRDVMNLFYQVFDKGFMRDGEGREINFKNTVIIMTSNLATDIITYVTSGGEEDEYQRPTMDQLRQVIHDTLVEHFQPALVGRMKVIPFYTLDPDSLAGIVRLKLGKVVRRLHNAHNIDCTYDDAVVDYVASQCTQVDSGARNIDFIIDRTLLPEISSALLLRMVENNMPSQLSIGLDTEEGFTYQFT